MAAKDATNTIRGALNIKETVAMLKSIVEFNLVQAQKNSSAGTNDYIVPFLVGSPGVGKTAAPQIVCEDLSIPYFQTIVAQFDAGELAGLTFPQQKEIEGKMRHVATRLRPDYLPDEDEPVGVLNLDELPQAFLAQQNVCSQLVNQWSVGKHKVSRGICIMATGNRPEDRAGTTVMPTHLKDRLTRIDIGPDPDEWVEYAQKKGLDFRVRTYIKEFPGNLNDFDPKADGNPTPRSWEKTAHILSLDLTQRIRKQMIEGQIGIKYGDKFETWLRIESKLPKFEEVLRDPNGVSVFPDPKDASVLYMFLANIADRVNEKNADQCIAYVKRLHHADMLAWWLKDALTQHPQLKKHKSFTSLIVTHGSKLIGE